jgi:uncharacterized delta-60 repeat protein
MTEREHRVLGSLLSAGLVAAACTGGSGAGSGLDVVPSPVHETAATDVIQSQAEGCPNEETGRSAGDLDTTFGCDGTVIEEWSPEGTFPGLSPAYAVAIQVDEKIVAVGGTGMFTGGGNDNNFALARYNPDGSADPTFGQGGRVATKVASLQEAHSVAIQDNGRIVVAGSSTYGGAGTVSLARYKPDGRLDAAFSKKGWVKLPWTGRAYAVAVQNDGGIIVAGGSRGVAPAGGEVMLARYTPNGSLDPTFGSRGLVTTRVGHGVNIAYDIAVQPDERILVAGQAAGALLLARYTSNGSLDPTFGESGLVTARFGPGPDIAYGLAVQPDGRIVVAGQAADAILLARYESNGSPDASFGRGGRTITDVTAGDDVGRGVLVQTDGKIVVAGGVKVRLPSGWPRDLHGGRSAVLRYLDDGSLDPSFGRGGLATPAFGEKVGIAYSVAIQANGRIVVAGSVGREAGGVFALARYVAGANRGGGS